VVRGFVPLDNTHFFWHNLQMIKSKKNYQKKMAQLRYKDLILQMYNEKKPVVEITKNINFRLSKSKIKTTLSVTTIKNLLKKYGSIK